MQSQEADRRLSRRRCLRLLGLAQAALPTSLPLPALAAPVIDDQPPTLPEDWRDADAKLYRYMVGRSRDRTSFQAPAEHARRCGERWRYWSAFTFTTRLWRCLGCGYVGRADGLGAWR